MYYTDDPIADFERWDRDRERKRQKLPRCEGCDEHIQQEDAVYIDDKWYCDDCLYKARIAIEVDW